MSDEPAKSKDVFGIIPQIQPTPKTCMQTCIAMAMGEPADKVIAIYGEEAMDHKSLLVAITKCGILWNQFMHGTLVHQGWYFAMVPSLNHRAMMHEILLRFTFDDGLTVIDPAIGQSYNKYGSDLMSWANLIAFIPGGKLK